MTLRRLATTTTLLVAGMALAPATTLAQLAPATGSGASYQYYRFDDPDAAQTSSIAHHVRASSVNRVRSGGR